MLPWSLHTIEEETEVSWLGQGMGKTTRHGAVKEARSTTGSQELEANLKWQSFKTPNLTHSDTVSSKALLPSHLQMATNCDHVFKCTGASLSTTVNTITKASLGGKGLLQFTTLRMYSMMEGSIKCSCHQGPTW